VTVSKTLAWADALMMGDVLVTNPAGFPQRIAISVGVVIE
jgi:hypothetical protein